MGWVNHIPGEPHKGSTCPGRPKSERGTAFAPGSTWQCDNDACGKIWRFDRYHDDQLDPWDDWTQIEPPLLRGSFQ